MANQNGSKNDGWWSSLVSTLIPSVKTEMQSASDNYFADKSLDFNMQIDSNIAAQPAERIIKNRSFEEEPDTDLDEKETAATGTLMNPNRAPELRKPEEMVNRYSHSIHRNQQAHSEVSTSLIESYPTRHSKQLKRPAQFSQDHDGGELSYQGLFSCTPTREIKRFKESPAKVSTSYHHPKDARKMPAITTWHPEQLSISANPFADSTSNRLGVLRGPPTTSLATPSRARQLSRTLASIGTRPYWHRPNASRHEIEDPKSSATSTPTVLTKDDDRRTTKVSDSRSSTHSKTFSLYGKSNNESTSLPIQRAQIPASSFLIEKHNARKFIFSKPTSKTSPLPIQKPAINSGNIPKSTISKKTAIEEKPELKEGAVIVVEEWKKPAPKWICTECFVPNGDTCAKCVCCGSDKVQDGAKNSALPSTFSSESKWSCPVCFVSNESSAFMCVCCQTPRATSNKHANTIGSFGNNVEKSGLFPTISTSSFGIKKNGQTEKDWSCTTCFVSNGADVLACRSCEAPRPGQLFKPVTFGLPPVSAPSVSMANPDKKTVRFATDLTTTVEVSPSSSTIQFSFESAAPPSSNSQPSLIVPSTCAISSTTETTPFGSAAPVFTFGGNSTTVPSTSTVGSAAPVFTFGGNSTTVPSTSTVGSAAPVFTFGGNSTTVPSTSTVGSAAPVFTFGAKSLPLSSTSTSLFPSVESTSEAVKKSPFTFVKATESLSKIPSLPATFTFGSNLTSNATKNDTNDTIAIKSTSSLPTTIPSFNFGQSTKSTAFSFGSSTNQPKFEFGNNSATTPSSSSSSLFPTLATSVPVPVPVPAPFSFDPNNAIKVPSQFNFGAASTSSAQPVFQFSSDTNRSTASPLSSQSATQRRILSASRRKMAGRR